LVVRAGGLVRARACARRPPLLAPPALCFLFPRNDARTHAHTHAQNPFVLNSRDVTAVFSHTHTQMASYVYTARARLLGAIKRGRRGGAFFFAGERERSTQPLIRISKRRAYGAHLSLSLSAGEKEEGTEGLKPGWVGKNWGLCLSLVVAVGCWSSSLSFSRGRGGEGCKRRGSRAEVGRSNNR
jgi:hypothetical protein